MSEITTIRFDGDNLQTVCESPKTAHEALIRELLEIGACSAPIDRRLASVAALIWGRYQAQCLMSVPQVLDCLYLVELGNGTVKVGISKHPEKRLKTHSSMAAAHGRRVGRIWLSSPDKNAPDAERSIRAGNTNEYIKSSFDELVFEAESLGLTGKITRCRNEAISRRSSLSRLAWP